MGDGRERSPSWPRSPWPRAAAAAATAAATMDSQDASRSGTTRATTRRWARPGTRPIEIFKAEHPGVTVKVEKQDFEQIQKNAKIVLTGDDVPDVMEYNKGNATAGQLASQGLLTPLTDVAKEKGWDKTLSRLARHDGAVRRERPHGLGRLVRRARTTASSSASTSTRTCSRRTASRCRPRSTASRRRSRRSRRRASRRSPRPARSTRSASSGTSSCCTTATARSSTTTSCSRTTSTGTATR